MWKLARNSILLEPGEARDAAPGAPGEWRATGPRPAVRLRAAEGLPSGWVLVSFAQGGAASPALVDAPEATWRAELPPPRRGVVRGLVRLPEGLPQLWVQPEGASFRVGRMELVPIGDTEVALRESARLLAQLGREPRRLGALLRKTAQTLRAGGLTALRQRLLERVAAAAGHLGAPVVLLSLATGIALFGLMPLHERLGIVARLEKRLGVDLAYATFDWRHWLLAVAGYCGMMMIYGLGGVALAAALQPGISVSTAAAVVAGMCLSWLVGTAIAIAPAGLGVREATMALALASLPGRLGFVLPIATRLLLLAVDLVLVAAALGLLWYRPGDRPLDAGLRQDRRPGSDP